MSLVLNQAFSAGAITLPSAASTLETPVFTFFSAYDTKSAGSLWYKAPITYINGASPSYNPQELLTALVSPTSVSVGDTVPTLSYDAAGGFVSWTLVRASPTTTAGTNSLSLATPAQPASSSPTSSSVVSTSASTTSTVETNVGSSSSGSSASHISISSASSRVPSPTSASAKSDSKRISGGAAAGIAVGCLVAGAVIAGLLFWFCGRRSSGRGKRDREAGAVAFLPREKQADANVQSIGSSSPVSGIVDANLPQPLEDNAIAGEINKIGSLIKNHVQSFYHGNRVSAGAADFEAFQTLGNDLPISAGTLGTLLANPATREVALRFYIARVIIPRCEFDSEPSVSFLPPEIAACIRSMSSFTSSTQVRSAFLSKWRSVTAELTQATYTRNPFSPADARNVNISRTMEEMDSVLQLYTDSRNDNIQRRRNLEEILKRVATFAFTLFSQPSSWKLDWQEEKGVEPGSLVIFPALVQLSDETGQPLRHPRPLSEPTVRRIDG